MADEYDYALQWPGTYVAPRPVDDGISILEDEKSVGRNTRIYDEATRVLYDDVHPRNSPGGRRYPGPYGGGRASDRVGPSLEERERFAARHDVTPAEHARYVRGSRELGHPGPRGMVTSSRRARAAVDGVDWDDRPPHYAPEAPNEYAHLYVDPAARGPALTRRDLVYPGFRQVDKFGAAPAAPLAPRFDLRDFVLFFIIVTVIAFLISEWRINAAVQKMSAVSGRP